LLPFSGHATGAHPQDHPRSRRHVQPEVPSRQTSLSRSSQVHAARCPQALGEHADALGTGKIQVYAAKKSYL